jgi:hypothetical protein
MTTVEEDNDAIDEKGFLNLAKKLENVEVKEDVVRGYDVYQYFIANVDTYFGKTLVNSIRKG